MGEGSSLLMLEACNFCISLLVAPEVGRRGLQGAFLLMGRLCGAQAIENASCQCLAFLGKADCRDGIWACV